jgi:hypothetical protein
MCLSNQTDNQRAIAPSMGNALKHSYPGLITGLDREMLEPCRERTASKRFQKAMQEVGLEKYHCKEHNN